MVYFTGFRFFGFRDKVTLFCPLSKVYEFAAFTTKWPRFILMIPQSVFSASRTSHETLIKGILSHPLYSRQQHRPLDVQGNVNVAHKLSREEARGYPHYL